MNFDVFHFLSILLMAQCMSNIVIPNWGSKYFKYSTSWLPVTKTNGPNIKKHGDFHTNLWSPSINKMDLI